MARWRPSPWDKPQETQELVRKKKEKIIMEQLGPRPFTNWGDWLIQRSTGALGDLRMSVCIAILRNAKFSRGWVGAMTSEDITRILARYKEHVIFWNIRPDVIQNELYQFAEAGGWDLNYILALYENAPLTRYRPEYDTSPPTHW
jgi:hypothetical protein